MEKEENILERDLRHRERGGGMIREKQIGKNSSSPNPGLIAADAQVKNRNVSAAIGQWTLIGWKKLKQKSH